MVEKTTPLAATSALDRLLRPRSVGIVGASPEPGSFGNAVLANLQRCNYQGAIHLVSRNRKEIAGLACVPTIDDLPLGTDAVVLIVPEAAVIDAVTACVRREIGGAVVFAAGFAETGAEGKAKQERLAAIAREGGLALNGPNCAGLVNLVDGIPLTFEPSIAAADIAPSGVGIIAQSGGMMGNIRLALKMKGVPTTFAVSTGNEAVLGLEDFLAYMLEGEGARVIALFIEEVRRPRLFLELLARARMAGRPVVLMHPGRTRRARSASLSHTGALAGDHAVMETVLREAGVILIDTLDEFFDVTAMIARWPRPSALGPGIMTNSGAFRAVALDFCADAGLDLPLLAEPTKATLERLLPAYAAIDNPLDLTTIGLGNPDVFGRTAAALLGDPAIGGLITAFMPGSPQLQVARAKSMLPVIEHSEKPVAFAHFTDGTPLAEEFAALMRAARLPVFQSPDRAMRAMAHLAAYGAELARNASRAPAEAAAPLPLPGRGVIPEYRAKRALAALGLAVPKGEMAHDLAAALAIADRIGYPVALKAQSAALAHKSDAGGVILGIAQADALRAAWDRLHDNVARAKPGLALDGVLIEAMARPGLELIIGARREREWGPVLLVGLGGIWTEALEDIRLISPALDEAGIDAEIGKLKGAALLAGARGGKPLDRRALAQAVAILARAIRGTPDLQEIEINPLVVYPEGEGVVALDALIVAAED
jgi:acetate---CoA ligase (ADP-forming)